MSVGPLDVNASSQATVQISGNGNSPLLTQLMLDMQIEPGTSPSYELCKTIYAYHPLGHRMAADPVTIAQSQSRKISVDDPAEEELVKAFEKEWAKLGGIGASSLIHNLTVLSRVYGLSSVAILCREKDGTILPTEKPLPMDRLHELDLYFNTLDPLNTAGSLVLNQDPNAIDFMKPITAVRVGSQVYHVSKTCVVMNEQPIWIEWTGAAFGFVGRSVYQRALYPMSSYLLSMIADNSIQEKLMTIVYKMVSVQAILDRVAQWFSAAKRAAIKYARTGNVVSIGDKEDLQSIDLMHTKEAGEYSRKNILDNIANSDSMPSSMLTQQSLAEGFGEGTEDAKLIARYIDRIRTEMDPTYRFFDEIVMRRAWSPDFFGVLKSKFPGEYKNMEYPTAFYKWKNAFTANWPNLLAEPDSEKSKVADVKIKSAAAIAEILLPIVDPENKAKIVQWLADNVNNEELLFTSFLEIDAESLASYVPPVPVMGQGEEEPKAPEPFGFRS